MNATNAKLWIVLGRPTRLPAALIAVNSLGHRFPGGCHLLRDDSSWWERADWEPLADRFTDVHRFRRVRTCRGIADLPRLYRDISRRKEELAALPVDPQHDVLLCLASVMGVANAAASIHRDVYKVLCLSLSDYARLNQTPDRMRFRFTTSGWLQNRVIEPLVGLERTLHLKPRLNPGGDGVRLVRLERGPAEIYDRILVLSNSGRGLPAIANERVLPAQFPSMAELPEFANPPANRSGANRVVFFGTPFLLVHNLPPDEYVAQLDRCLDYIRRWHPKRRWIYRPHPAETEEARRLNLAGFEIEDDREAAELYFLQRFGEIEAVYSVSSTVSRVALNNGLNAYAFWRCFSFPETAAKFFAQTMGDVPLEFEIADLGQAPVPYQQKQIFGPDSHRFGQVLQLALERG